MTKNRGQASLGKTVEPNGDSEIEIDDQEVDMKSDTSMKDVSDNSKRKRGIEAVGWKTEEEDNETGFEAKRNKKGSNKRKGMNNHDSNGKKEPESNQSMKEKTKVRGGGR